MYLLLLYYLYKMRFFFFYILGIAVIASPLINKNERLLGLKQCTFGPTFWCSNIT